MNRDGFKMLSLESTEKRELDYLESFDKMDLMIESDTFLTGTIQLMLKKQLQEASDRDSKAVNQFINSLRQEGKL